MVKEADIEKYLVKKVKAVGGEVRKCAWLGRNGCPDRRVMLPYGNTRPTRAFWVELKAPGEKPTPAQLREHDRMTLLGEIVFTLNSFAQVDHLVEFGYV